MENTLNKIFSLYTEDELMPHKYFDELMKHIKFDVSDDESFYDPIYVAFDDFDKRHNESVDQPIYLNDFDFNIQEDRDTIISLLRTEYEQNNFSTIGSCTCKRYRANMYVNSSFRCDVCNDPVVKPLSANFTTRVWLRRPANIAGFIVPSVYDTFLRKLNTKTPKVNIVDYWINPTLRKEKRFSDPLSTAYKVAQKLEEFRKSLGIQFGYNDFVAHIDTIVSRLLENDYLRILSLKQNERESYIEFWNRYKGYATSSYFPVPNKIMTIVETDNRNKYYTKEQMEVNKLFLTIADLYDEDDPRSIENPDIMGKLHKNLVSAIAEVRNNVLFGKKGSIRHSAGSGRLPCTGRTIISGDSGVCRSDTTTVPWHYALTCLNKHLLNWLYRRGYTPIKAKNLIRNAAKRNCPVIEEFITWVEDNKYAMAMVGRNPMLQYLSSRAMFIKFNRNVDDLSMRIPITTTRPFGADFDGDAQYVRFLCDLISKISAYSAWGHQQSLDPNEIFKSGGFCYQSKSNLVSVNSLILNTPIEK